MEMSESHWRSHSSPIIARVIAEHGKDSKALAAALREAYPFGQRKYHPYKIWLDEIARQLGKKPPLGTCPPRSRVSRSGAAPDPRQECLFS